MKKYSVKRRITEASGLDPRSILPLIVDENAKEVDSNNSDQSVNQEKKEQLLEPTLELTRERTGSVARILAGLEPDEVHNSTTIAEFNANKPVTHVKRRMSGFPEVPWISNY